MRTARRMNSPLFVVAPSLIIFVLLFVSSFTPWREASFLEAIQSATGLDSFSMRLLIEIFPFIAAAQTIGAIFLVCLSALILLLQPRFEQKSDAAAYLLRPCRRIIGFILFSFIAGQILLLILGSRVGRGIDTWDGWFIISTLMLFATFYLNQKAVLTFGEGRGGIAPTYAVLIVTLTFLGTFAWRQLSYNSQGVFNSRYYWVTLGIEIVGALHLALCAEALMISVLLGVHLSSDSLLRAWFMRLTARKLAVKAYDEGIDACTAVMSICSRSPEFVGMFQNIHGVCLYQKGEFQVAVNELSKAIDLAPLTPAGHETPGIKKAITYHNRADAYFKLGKLSEALADCEEGLKVDPSDETIKELKKKIKGHAASTYNSFNPTAR